MLKRIVFVLLALILVSGIGYWGFMKFAKEKSETVELLKEKTLPSISSSKEWKTYVSKYGFSVKYPADWTIDEDTYGKAFGYKSGELPVLIGGEGVGFSIEYGREASNYNFSMNDFLSNKNIAHQEKIERLAKDLGISNRIKKTMNTKIIKLSNSFNIIYEFSGYSKKEQTEKYFVVFYLSQKDVLVGIEYYFSDQNSRRLIQSIIADIRINEKNSH